MDVHVLNRTLISNLTLKVLNKARSVYLYARMSLENELTDFMKCSTRDAPRRFYFNNKYTLQ